MSSRDGSARRTSVAVVAVATGALVLGVGGGAVGGALVTSKQIKNNSIKGVDVRTGTLRGSDVGDGSLGGVDVADGSLGGADVTDGSIGSADLAPDARTYWVAVNANGSLARASAGAGLASSRFSAGQYVVQLPAGVDVNRCGVFATRGRTNGNNGFVGFISASVPFTGDASKVFVQTFAPGATEAIATTVDGDFFLLVDC